MRKGGTLEGPTLFHITNGRGVSKSFREGG